MNFKQGIIQEGREDYGDGASIDDCPYGNKNGQADAWRKGWLEARSQDQDADDHDFYEDDF